jgi:hypothetical protein
MRRGEKVIVIAFGGRELERIVWEDAGAGILICTEEGYTKAIHSGGEPVCVGFPASDVRRKPMGTAATETHKRKAG